MSGARRSIIDCDVHVQPGHPDEIRAYLAQPWKPIFKLRENVYYPRPAAAGERRAESRARAASDPALMRREWIEPGGIRHAVLIPAANVAASQNPDYAAATAEAYNRWMADTWLGEANADGVFKGSILIAHQHPTAAAAEIERWADHPHFVQVMLESGARAPFGQRQYDPIFAACERRGLPCVIHPGSDGLGVNQPAAQGYPTYYLEYYAGLSIAMQSHLVSLLTEGAFERFPQLRIAIAEGGFLWPPALMWRLDQEYKGLRSEVPWLSRKPSDYLRDHVRFTSHPPDRSENEADWLDMLAFADAQQLLMYASDYPFDTVRPEEALAGLPEAAQERIYSSNAEQWYALAR